MNEYSDITLYISLSAIAENYQYFQNRAENTICSAVVKADAYGLGVEKISLKLYEKNCRDFFVANLDEAIELREIFQKHKILDTKIYVFHGVKNPEAELFQKFSLIPVINDFYQIEYWLSFCQKIKQKLPCTIHIDTGMNRLGINFSELQKLKNFIIENKNFLNIKYIMSHLSCINEKDHPLNKIQLDKVKIIRENFPNIPISFANSKGTACCPNYHYDMVRPGSGLYGIRGKYEVPVKKVIKITAKILQIREISDEGFIGYGAISKLPKGSRVAVAPIGYADGYFRINSNKEIFAKFKDEKIPQIGLISMDMTIFDITNIDKNSINIGDEIEIINDEFDVDLISQKAGTIGYEFMTGLGKRFKRIYL